MLLIGLKATNRINTALTYIVIRLLLLCLWTLWWINCYIRCSVEAVEGHKIVGLMEGGGVAKSRTTFLWGFTESQSHSIPISAAPSSMENDYPLNGIIAYV